MHLGGKFDVTTVYSHSDTIHERICPGFCQLQKDCWFCVYDHGSLFADVRFVLKICFISWFPNNSTPYHKIAMLLRIVISTTMLATRCSYSSLSIHSLHCVWIELYAMLTPHSLIDLDAILCPPHNGGWRRPRLLNNVTLKLCYYRICGPAQKCLREEQVHLRSTILP